MPITATFFAAVIPMLTYLFFIWKADKYEREPLKYLLMHFIWGAIGAIIIAILGSQILSMSLSAFLTAASLSLIQIIFIAPLVEEIAKASLLFKTVNNIKFDNLTDGLVYGGAIGLGFGMTENFMYFLSNSDDTGVWISVVIIRSCFSAVMHAISTASFGALLVLAKYSSSFKKILLPVAGFFISAFIHFLWNFTVINSDTVLLGFLFIIVLIAFFIILFKLSIKKEREFIFRELEEESDIIPENHLKILSSDERNKKGWIEESIRKDYIKSATKLAFRKMEIKSCSIRKRKLYEDDIEKQRNFIHSILFGDKNN